MSDYRDLIVNLYERDKWRATASYEVRKAADSDNSNLQDFLRFYFPVERYTWNKELKEALEMGKMFVVIHGDKIIGLACYDVAGTSYFGPIGVVPEYRHKGAGTELFHACLDAMKEEGAGYAIIGYQPRKYQMDCTEFYKKVGDAVEIPNSMN